MEIIYEVLQMIWKTYHYSPQSTRELQAIGNKLGVSVLKPTQVSGTRWLPHISRALKVLITPNSDGSGQYAAVLCHMDHLSATSKNAHIKGRAKFVSDRMRSIRFSALSFPGGHVCINFEVTSEDAKKWFNSSWSSVAPPCNNSQC